MGGRGDLLWPFPRRCREIHDRHFRTRDAGSVVSAGRCSAVPVRKCRSGDGVHVGHLLLPSNITFSPIAEQLACRDLGAGSATVQKYGPALITTGSLPVQFTSRRCAPSTSSRCRPDAARHRRRRPRNRVRAALRCALPGSRRAADIRRTRTAIAHRVSSAGSGKVRR